MANYIYTDKDINALVNTLERWKKRLKEDKKNLINANKSKVDKNITYHSNEVKYSIGRIADIKKSLAQAQSHKQSSKKTEAASVKRTSKNKALKHSNAVAISKLDMFEKSNPDLFKKTSPKRKVAPKRKKIAQGTKKIAKKAKTAKTASNKAAAVKKSLSILELNVKHLLAEFDKIDAKKLKTINRAKSRSKR